MKKLIVEIQVEGTPEGEEISPEVMAHAREVYGVHPKDTSVFSGNKFTDDDIVYATRILLLDAVHELRKDFCGYKGWKYSVLKTELKDS